MAVTVAVRPPVLEWARRRSGRANDDMRSEFANWDQWLSEERRPRFAEVEAVARFTHVPVGYLFLSEPPMRSSRFPISVLVEVVVGSRRMIFLRRFISINVVRDGMKTIWMRSAMLSR